MQRAQRPSMAAETVGVECGVDGTGGRVRCDICGYGGAEGAVWQTETRPTESM